MIDQTPYSLISTSFHSFLKLAMDFCCHEMESLLRTVILGFPIFLQFRIKRLNVVIPELLRNRRDCKSMISSVGDDSVDSLRNSATTSYSFILARRIEPSKVRIESEGV